MFKNFRGGQGSILSASGKDGDLAVGTDHSDAAHSVVLSHRPHTASSFYSSSSYSSSSCSSSSSSFGESIVGLGVGEIVVR